MKRLLAVLICAAAIFCCTVAASCSGGSADGVFVFLSVRLKGNGDGTVTAVAQNEFAIGSTVLPVTLTMYRADEFTAETARMTETDTVSSEDLNLLNTLTLVTEVDGEGWYCARISYEVNGSVNYLQSETLHYGKDGLRV